MNKLKLNSQASYRKARVKGRHQSGVIQKRPFDWGRLGHFLYRSLRFLFLTILLVVIVVGPFYGWQYLKKSNIFFKIDTVSVYGEVKHLPQERINELVKDGVGQNLIGLNMQQYQDNILAESWIKSVSLKRNWFHELEVHIVEEQPIAIWNENRMLDIHGEVFSPSFIPEEDWVLLSGPDDKALEVLKVYHETVAKLEGSGFALQQLALDENDSWTILLDNNLLLIMGSEDFRQRLRRFLRQFPDRDVLDLIQHIDFRYKNGFSVKWKEGQNNSGIERKL